MDVPLPREIGKRKAEIQVRTFLQHAWASISHDNLYKNQFVAPDEWHREMARLAAVLEEADKGFAQFVARLDAYSQQYSAYMTRGQMDREIATLKIILDNEPIERAEGRQKIALRIARIHKAAGEWSEVERVLSDYLVPEKSCCLQGIGPGHLSAGSKPEKAYRSIKARVIL